MERSGASTDDVDAGSRLAWIGLGKLGLPMAARIAVSGAMITAFDTDEGRLRLARDRGVDARSAVADAVRGASVVFTSLPDDRALLGVAETVFAFLDPGTVVVETSTVSPGASAEAAARASARGLVPLRAPVSGNPVLAERGELTVIASGPRDGFEVARPAMAAFSRAQHWIGEAEEARYAKLAINLMIAVSAGMMAEALAFAEKGGVDPGRMLDLMADSAVASPMVKYKSPPLKAGDYASTFSCRQMAKDLDLILAASRVAEAPAPLAAMLRETYSALIATGSGEDDFIATVRQARRLAGLA